jgi:hypothetical protein
MQQRSINLWHNGVVKKLLTLWTVRIAVPVLIFLAAGPLRPLPAELSPQEYTRMRAEAPVLAAITVDRVRRGLGLFRETIPVTVHATVHDVRRGEGLITEGGSILIVYEHRRPRRGWVGPRPIPLLRRGTRYTAYLLPSDDGHDTFYPAARGASFE